MSKLLDQMIASVESAMPQISDVKLFSLKQVTEMMEKVRKMERAFIEENFILTPKGSKEGVVFRQPNEFFELLKRRAPKNNPLKWNPSKFVTGTAEEVMGQRPMTAQWDDQTAICKANVENAVTVLLNRGATVATVRDIVDVIKQFVPTAFEPTRKMVDYRHRVTKKFLSSDKKLLGRFGSVVVKNEYQFSIK